MLRLVVGFLPWIILAVLGYRWFLLALVLALAAAAVTTVRQFLGRSLKILDTVTFAFFAFVVVGVIGLRWMILATYMSILVNVTLMAIALGSLLAACLSPSSMRASRSPRNSGVHPCSSVSINISRGSGASTSFSPRSFRSIDTPRRYEPCVAGARGFSSRWARRSSRSISRPFSRALRAAPRSGERARIAFARGRAWAGSGAVRPGARSCWTLRTPPAEP